MHTTWLWRRHPLCHEPHRTWLWRRHPPLALAAHPCHARPPLAMGRPPWPWPRHPHRSDGSSSTKMARATSTPPTCAACASRWDTRRVCPSARAPAHGTGTRHRHTAPAPGLPPPTPTRREDGAVHSTGRSYHHRHHHPACVLAVLCVQVSMRDIENMIAVMSPTQLPATPEAAMGGGGGGGAGSAAADGGSAAGGDGSNLVRRDTAHDDELASLRSAKISFERYKTTMQVCRPAWHCRCQPPHTRALLTQNEAARPCCKPRHAGPPCQGCRSCPHAPHVNAHVRVRMGAMDAVAGVLHAAL